MGGGGKGVELLVGAYRMECRALAAAPPLLLSPSRTASILPPPPPPPPAGQLP